MKKLLLISTGGTMGMQMSESGSLSSRHFIQEIFRYVPDARKLAEIDLLTPFTIDSTELGIAHWIQLGDLIYEALDQYDGFVIIHGTDTLSYTACALSYMLVNLTKPVILTGSQRPLSALRTDARGNLVGAIELATKPITEVCVYFDHHLYRGNRTKKCSIDDFDAFRSPNYPPLAEVGLHIEKGAPIRKPTGLVRLETRFDDRVLALPLFPSMNPSYWAHVTHTDALILIIEAFGAGNVPTTDGHFIDSIRECTEAGKLVVICSQSPEGTCDLELYEGGKAAAEAGAIGAGDMTFEATIVKSMFLLGLFHGDTRKVRSYFHFSIAGEISEDKGSLLS